MDPDEQLRRAVAAVGGDLWGLIDAALAAAARDCPAELRSRRDGIVELLYSGGRCRNCDVPEAEAEADAGGEDEADELGGAGASMESKILAIKDFLEDPDQPEDALLSLLQNLADMDITYKALQETDIGRHVNGLRKYPSGEVRRLVKQLVRKWKEIVDDWVRLHNSGSDGGPIITDGDSPEKIQGKNCQNAQVSEFKYSPSPQRHNGLSSERANNYNGIDEAKRRASPAPMHHITKQQNSNQYAPSSSAPARMMREQQEQKDNLFNREKLDSARKRLQENYQEAQNAKKQRTIQVMDIHDIPKPRNAFFRKGGGGGLPARHR